MDAATLPCEQCGQQVARDAATYSTAGQLVCPACSAKGLTADGDARAAASRRSMRILAVVSAALVVGVPSIMIVAGVGQYVATGLIIIGALLLMGGRQARRMSTGGSGDPGVARGAIFVMLAGVACILLGALLNSVLGR
jgi:hypothetical protein